MPGPADPVRLLAAGVLLGGTLVAVAACNNKGCVQTEIAVRSMHVASSKTPLTLTASLTRKGKPVPDFRLSFFLSFTGPTQLVGKSGHTGDLIGYATTDANGVARRQLRSGWASAALPGETAVGYQVTLTTGNPINGEDYCDAKASASFT